MYGRVRIPGCEEKSGEEQSRAEQRRAEQRTKLSSKLIAVSQEDKSFMGLSSKLL